jgi:hypothetical protein
MSCLKPLQPIEVSNLVNDMPVLYGQVMDMNLFRFKGAYTNTVAIDRTNYTPGLIPASPWCCDSKVTQGSPTRQLFPVQIPHTQIEDALWACDLNGVRGENTGLQVSYASVDAERAKVLMRMRMNMDITAEYRMLSALKGQVLDADGTNVLLDIFELFGVTQKTQDIPLNESGTDVLGAFREAVRKSRDGARSFIPQRWVVLAGKTFFDRLVSHDSLRDMYKRCCDVQAGTLNDMSSGMFNFMPNVSVMEYTGTVARNANGDDVVYLADTEAIMFPIPAPGQEMYELLAAPPMTMNYVNTQASSIYYFWESLLCPRGETDPEGIKFVGEMNVLPIVKHPAAIIRLNMTCGPDPIDCN